MIMFIWYCPQCDKPTQNYRTCPKCKGGAVCQKFQLWPINELTEDEKRALEIYNWKPIAQRKGIK